jgi:hypothetical protein
MTNKSLLTKILGITLITTAVSGYPSQSYENNEYFNQKSFMEARETTKEMIKKREIRENILASVILSETFTPEKTVELLDKGINRGEGLPDYMNEGFVYCIVKKESNWNPNAMSHENAKGLGQLTQATWEENNPEVSYNRVYDPEANLETVVKTINGNEKYFGINHPNWESLPTQEKLEIHAATYNWGRKNLKKIGWNLNKKNKIPRETKDFVYKIIKSYNSLQPKASNTSA